jgi:predicted glycosyltransferase
MSRSLKLVFYAVNGSGVGHLTRLLAIARWVRRYAAHAGARPEIYFLTSSEADSLIFQERFASFKMPSKTSVGAAGIDKVAYLALAKQWVWHSLGLLRPDLFVVDTFPRGSFGELLSALDLCRRRAFVYRPTKEGFSARPDFQAMLPLYDVILVPDNEARARIVVPESARAKVRHLGPILLRDRGELLPRAAAREALGIEEGHTAVYVSAGGGGDTEAAGQLARVVAALREVPDLCLVIGAGPLYRGRPVHGARIRWLAGTGAQELMAGFDLAVCAAGYNTFHELMNAGVPAVFLPLAKVADDQALRAAEAERRGAAVVLADAGDPVALRAAVERLRQPEARAAASEAARLLVPRSHARDAAAELLRLVLPPAAVDAAEEAVGDALLHAARDLDLDLDPFFDVMHALSPAAVEGAPAAPSSPKAASDLTVELLRAAAELGVPPLSAARVSAAFSRRLAQATPAERAAASRRLLGALAPFHDWPGATTLLKLLGTERRLGADALAGELGRLLAALGERGADLYRGVALLAAAQGAGAEAPPNAELIQTALAALETA